MDDKTPYATVDEAFAAAQVKINTLEARVINLEKEKDAIQEKYESSACARLELERKIAVVTQFLDDMGFDINGGNFESCVAKAIAELSMKLNMQYETVLDLQLEIQEINSGLTFDPKFNAEIRELAPHWFKSKKSHDKTDLK